MSCCDECGNCNQGRNCPCRVAKSVPKTLLDTLAVIGWVVFTCFWFGYFWYRSAP